MKILVTGAAGFIGHAVSRALLEREEPVVGIDNMNDGYDVGLKRDRVANLQSKSGFNFIESDVSCLESLESINSEQGPFKNVIHLSAQAGVRKSMEMPFEFVQDNIVAHMNILELCRATDGFEHLVFASSSSVYGANIEPRSSTSHRADQPMSLYAATKAADELMSYSYSHLFGMPQTALRFFTVYGPWGRPDMAIFLFTRLIEQGKPITVFNAGDMNRDFTYIDDVVDGVLKALSKPPARTEDGPPYRVYNLGSGKSETLGDMITMIERGLGRKADIIHAPKQAADPQGSLADIDDSIEDLGYEPKTSLSEGISKFLEWYRIYHS